MLLTLLCKYVRKKLEGNALIKKTKPIWLSLFILNLVLSPVIFINPGECSGFTASMSDFEEVFLTQRDCCCSRMNVKKDIVKRDCCNSPTQTKNNGDTSFSPVLLSICKCIPVSNPSDETSYFPVPSFEEFWLWVILADSPASEAVPDIRQPVNLSDAGLLHSDCSFQARLQIWLI